MTREFDVGFIFSKKNIRRGLYLGIIISFLCLLFMDIEKPYTSVRVLPLFYFMGFVLFARTEGLSRFSSSLLIALYFFKMAILPVLLAYGDFYSEIYPSIYLPHWNEAIFYSIIEWFTVIITLNVSLKLYKNHSRRVVVLKNKSKKRPSLNLTFPIMLGLLALMLIMLIVLNRDLLNYTYFIWQSHTEATPGPTYYIYMVFFEIFRITSILYTVHFLYEKKIPFMRFFSALLLLLNLSVMSSFRIISVFIFIVAYIYMAYRDRKYLKWYIFTLFFFFISFVLLTFIVTSNMKNSMMISRVFNIYFGGYMTMATGLSIDMSNSLTIFFNDLWNGNLLLTAIWGGKYSSTDVMNANVNKTAIGTFYQMYVQSKAFFGVFAPLPIAFLTWFVTFIENKFVFDSDLFHKTLYLFVIISVSIFMIMYSLTMILNFILYRMMIIFLMIYIDNRICIVSKK